MTYTNKLPSQLTRGKYIKIGKRLIREMKNAKFEITVKEQHD